MAKFMVAKKKKSTAPDADEWEERLEKVEDLEILQYMGGGKILIEHPDYVNLHVAISDVCDIGRV